MFDSSSCITVIIAVATLVLDIYICDELPQVHPHSVPHCLVNIPKLSPLLIPYCKRQKAGWGLRNKVMMSLNTRLYTKIDQCINKVIFQALLILSIPCSTRTHQCKRLNCLLGESKTFWYMCIAL